MSRRSRRSGMTLIELIVAVGVIGLLAALTISAVQSAREAARRMTCQNNLRQIGLALHGYHGDYESYPQCNTNRFGPVTVHGPVLDWRRST